MMLLGHRTVAAPCALILGATAPVPWPVSIVMGAVVIHSSGWNDLDHKHATASNEFGFLSRWLSITVRAVSWIIYLRTRTSNDKKRQDAHRGFTHTIEGCLTFAGVVTLVLALVPFTVQYSYWIGLAALIGTLSHLLGDMCTPSGVPLQITIPIDGRRWQRYAFGWKWLGIGWLSLPTPTVLTVGGRPGHRINSRHSEYTVGLFRTDSAGEHYIAIPLIWLATAAGCLAVTGTLQPLILAMLGL